MKEKLLRIEAGPYTEDLVNFICQNLTDEQLDQLDLERDRTVVKGLAREPITIAITIILSAKITGEVAGGAVAIALINTIGHLIEKWMDQKYNTLATDQAIKIAARDRETAKALLQNVQKFSKVAVENEIRPQKESE